MKIGDTVWYFDANHRVYEPNVNGVYPKGGPIWRKHWIPLPIVGETSRSWIVGESYRQRKLSKAACVSGNHPGWALSQAEIDEQEWLKDNRYAIAAMVQCVNDAAVMRQLAALIGYQERIA